MATLLTIIFFTLGLIIGSFLNVVIYRMNTRKSLGGRSACMSCENTLSWYELIPVFSYIGLKGRCKNCKIKISLQYPLVELTTAVVFAMIFSKFQDVLFSNLPIFTISFIYYAVMFALLIVIVVYDLKHKIIPDTLSFVFGGLAFLSLFFAGSGGLLNIYPHIPTTMDFFGAVLLALPFALIWLLSKGVWMGLGDAKLILGIGWFLGIPMALSGIVLAFWGGTIFGLYFMFFRKGYGMKTEIPFAPYLALGTFIAFLFELNLFNIYF